MFTLAKILKNVWALLFTTFTQHYEIFIDFA